MTDHDADALGHLDCLLLRHAGQAWLAPASLVAEVLPHFSGALPDSVSWRGLELACLADSHPARALVVMRRVQRR